MVAGGRWQLTLFRDEHDAETALTHAAKPQTHAGLPLKYGVVVHTNTHTHTHTHTQTLFFEARYTTLKRVAASFTLGPLSVSLSNILQLPWLQVQKAVPVLRVH